MSVSLSNCLYELNVELFCELTKSESFSSNKTVMFLDLKKFINLTRWYNEISDRKAVQKGYDLLSKNEQIPKP